MKKLMIAVASIAIAVIANAASVKWLTTYAVADGTSSGITTASMVYLIDSATLTQSSIYESVAGGKTLADTVGNSAVKSASLSNGEIAAQTFDAFNANEKKTLYMVLFDSKLGENGALYFSEQLTKTMLGTGAASFSFESDSSMNDIASNMTGFNATSGGWVAVGGSSPVPEPTSAMLLMLGLCGLALKRKNA